MATNEKEDLNEAFHLIQSFLTLNSSSPTFSTQQISNLATTSSLLFIEPFYGGSHKQLMDILSQKLPELLFPQEPEKQKNIIDLITLPAKKWKWRLRTSAIYLASKIPKQHNYKILFCSSMLNLSELLTIRPDLLITRKIIYFHENQLTYPSRFEKERDFQFGWNQIISSLAADFVIFNSEFNRNSFLSNLNSFVNKIPDYKPKGLSSLIEPKTQVIYFPLEFPSQIPLNSSSEKNLNSPLHILWNHRWEYDKRPDLFFNVLFQLNTANLPFHISVLGEKFEESPPIFDEAKVKLESHIRNWGYTQSKEEYFKILQEADVVVSTTEHEFFGVSVIEAILYHCYPLCPNRLVFPEYLSQEFLYTTESQLLKSLKYFCKFPHELREKKWNIDLQLFSWDKLKEQYIKIFQMDK